MTRLASRFGAVNLVRRDRPLTRDELAHYVPSVFSEESMNPAVTGTPISRLFPCSITYSVKASSHSLPARLEFEIRANVSIRSTCCACVVKVRLLANRFRK